jgi:hypothetical protein
MSNPIQIDQIAERVERLLVRHAELQRTNALLVTQVEALALLERLPDMAAVTKDPS